jgi:2-dehydropantoate 2-reductase
MKIAVLGSGAVGGYYGALLARADHDVVFIARGAHLDAISSKGLRVRGPLGDWLVPARAEHDTGVVGPVDLVLFAVKTYDNDTALPLLRPLVGKSTIVVTLQNGVDSPDAVAEVVGRPHVVGGAAYIATALSAPGVIDQTGTYRRIAFGEVFEHRGAVTPRVAALHAAFITADIQSEPAADGRVPLWEKFTYLAPFAGMTGAAIHGVPVPVMTTLYAVLRAASHKQQE